MRCAVLLSLTMLLGTACSQEAGSSPPESANDAQEDVLPATDAMADLSMSDQVDEPDGVSETSDGETVCPAPAVGVITFTTQDGVLLEADLHTTGVAGSPAVILLHMIPPGNDRSNYPIGFREELGAAGFMVLNVDRRGAGGSEGVATEAYDGPNGKLDAAAAVDTLAALPCPPNLDRLALVGASNGTTTALDYTVYSGLDPLNAPVPQALVFLTGGGYTENQHDLGALIESPDLNLGELPILFVYPQDEATWSEGFLETSAQWTHMSYELPGHGTHLFDSAPESMTDLIEWLSATL